ncbi:flavodoxin family protein [Methanolobus halotolerans]|uniref:Flavodoxin n=1 Tax=Methanolobus halotolerans TaxID=2052935 RepID=A0A4E0PUA7_9EURY|nr:flavodoxin family protein [Methanolobus halotolerans]TGC08529.1 flavodoxin [Methanolobus halotolerans]
MRTLVTYMTQTGNTKRIAEAIYEEVEGEKHIEEMATVDNPQGYDLIFAGYPIMQMAVPPLANSFLNDRTKGKYIAIFVTHAVPEGFHEIDKWMSTARIAAKGANIVGTFDCQGELASHIIDQLLKSDDPQMKAFADTLPRLKCVGFYG